MVIAFGLMAVEASAQKETAVPGVLFRENTGQVTDLNGTTVSSVLFSASAGDAGVFVTKHGLTYTFSKTEKNREAVVSKADLTAIPIPSPQSIEWINMHLEGADIRPGNCVRENAGSADFRFYKAHCPQGITGVREYGKITFREVYPGIDWVLYGSSKTGFKYDFIVHPGGDPANIRLVYEGDQPLKIDPKGNIVIDARLGNLTEHAPMSFIQDGEQIVASAFKSERVDRYNVRITYRLSDYPENETLVIDPQLVWGTNVGGSSTDDFHANTHVRCSAARCNKP